MSRKRYHGMTVIGVIVGLVAALCALTGTSSVSAATEPYGHFAKGHSCSYMGPTKVLIKHKREGELVGDTFAYGFRSTPDYGCVSLMSSDGEFFRVILRVRRFNLKTGKVTVTKQVIKHAHSVAGTFRTDNQRVGIRIKFKPIDQTAANAWTVMHLSAPTAP